MDFEGLAQNIGKVIDASHDEPISGASILFESGELQISDIAGGFSFTEGNVSAIISHIGYEDQKIQLSSDNPQFIVRLEAGTFNLQEVVVTAYHDNRKLIDTPGPIALISKKELDRDQDLIITNSLNRIPGVFMHSGALNTNRITIRGIGSRSRFSTNRVKAYLNEIPLTTGEGETTLEDIDLSLIDRVEIVRGPASGEFGAALGGVINLKIQQPDFIQNKIQTNTQIGSYGLTRNSSSFDLGLKNGSIKFLASKTKSDGYRDNNEYDREYGSITGQFNLSEKSKFSFIFNFIDLKAFIPSSLDSTTFIENPKAAAFIWKEAMGFEDNEKGFLGVSMEHQLSDRLNVAYSVFTNFRNSNEVQPFNILRENTSSYGFRFKYQYDLGPDKALPILTFGTEIFSDRLIATTHNNDSMPSLPGLIESHDNVDRSYQNYFLQGDWQINDKLALIAGVNLNHTKYDFEDLYKEDGDQSGEIKYKLIASPRIGLNYKLNLNSAMYAVISHGFGTPTFEETRGSEGLINPDITPETGYNYEIGGRGNLVNSRLTYDVSLFTLRVQDLLVSRRRREGSDEQIGVNAGKTTHHGFEMSLGYKLYENKSTLLQSLSSHVNYSYSGYKFNNFIDQENDYSGNRLTGIPRNTVNGVIELMTSAGIYGNVNYRFVDEIPILDDNSLFSDAYQVVNLKAGFQHTIGNFKFNIYGGINNLLDEKYATQLLINPQFNQRYFYPGQTANYFAGISLALVL